MWPISFGGSVVLALIVFQGILVWKESPKLLLVSIVLFFASWVLYLLSQSWWSYYTASAMGVVGLGVFIFSPFCSRPVLDRLKWPESKVLLRPPF